MKQVEEMPVAGEQRPQAENEDQDQQQTTFPLSFSAVVKSRKFLEEVADKEREAARQKQEKQVKKDAEDRKREDERKAKEKAKEDRALQKQQEDEARRAAHLAELAKK